MFFQFVASFAMFEIKVMLETQTILQFFFTKCWCAVVHITF